MANDSKTKLMSEQSASATSGSQSAGTEMEHATAEQVTSALREIRDAGKSLGPLSVKGGFAAVPVGTSLKDASLDSGLAVVCGHCLTLNSHNHTFFSVMDGISSPEAMTDMSAMRGFGGVGISDHGTMGGVLRAGKAGNQWKIGKLADGRTITYREVDLSAYAIRYTPVKSDFTAFPNGERAKQVLTLRSKCLVQYDPNDKKTARLVSKIEKYQLGEDIHEIDLTKSYKDLKILDEQWREIDFSPYESLLSAGQYSIIQHNPERPEEFRLVGKEEVLESSPFKVLSGCELYVSWRDKRDEKYNHITVYATGEKGHRALVLLTSIGSIPSRRYIGARGFFRPRVFMEDIEAAVAEANGELVVTTGCPISYTSDSLRKGKVDEARKIFEWGTRVLGPGRFFAELHLCDVSLDWNGRFAKAEDRFYGAMLGVPVSRFRFQSEQEALTHVTEMYQSLRVFSLAAPLRGFFANTEVSAKNMFQEVQFDLSSAANIETARAHQNFGRVHPLVDAGIFEDLKRLFTADDLASASRIETDTMSAAEDLLAAAVIFQEEGVKDDSSDQPTGSEPDAAASSPAQVSPTGLADPTSPSGSADAGAEATKTLLKKKKQKSNIRRQGDRVLVRVSGGRQAQLLDEDTLALLSAATKVIDALSGNGQKREKTPALVAASILARLAIFVIGRIGRDEDVSFCNPAEVLKTILALPNLKQLGDPGDAEVLLGVSQDRTLCLDLILSQPEGGDGLKDLYFSAARSILALLRHVRFDQSSGLSPSVGEEDGMEREWVVHPEGNWMDRVNSGLVALAKEYDVPLLMATDSHMTRPELKPVQDAVIRRGKRRGWHMSRPYAIPRSGVDGMLTDLGAAYKEGRDYISSQQNSAFSMIRTGIISLDDIIESLGSGALLLADAKSAGSFKWKTAVPKIKYQTHPYYDEAKALLDSGDLWAILSQPVEGRPDIKFSETSLDISTAIVFVTYLKATEQGVIPDTEPYLERILSELYLQQEVPNEKLADFFIIIQEMITRWRKKGVSVGPGRGSSGGMLTAMVSGITYGDPIKKGFLESRWMNRGRKAKGAHADIDIDVSDRQLAGYELAKLAREAFEDEVLQRPLSGLERTLHSEMFYSSAPVAHEVVGGVVREVSKGSKDVMSGFLKNIGGKVSKSLSDTGAFTNRGADGERDEDDVDNDSVSSILVDEDGGTTVWGAPIMRVGTYGSLKAKAAVKEAIRIADQTPFEKLPSFAEPPSSWLQENKSRLMVFDASGKASPMSDEEKNRKYEEERFGHLPIKERLARRRVRKGDRITKEMAAGAGLARLYQSERDYFFGSIYGVVPDYWDPSARPPSGSPEAMDYFDNNAQVKDLVLDMLNIYKSLGVHAGGFCIGREIFERIPIRADKHGYVAQYEMKDIEAVGILKFDVLGLETLDQISQTIRFILSEEPYERLAWWLPREVYDRVMAGESTDIVWRHIPQSTKAAIEAVTKNRAMTFQIDTKVFGKELDKLDPEAILQIVAKNGDPESLTNDKLTDILNAFLALFRPGPMKLNSHAEYIERMMGKHYTVMHPWLEPFVRDTLGLIVFQEQVMQIFRAAAIQLDGQGNPNRDGNGNYILASEELTDEFRRAMGKKDMAVLKKMRAEDLFYGGLSAQGVPADIARQIWETIAPFAEYGFNAPHSYHYGLISAVTLFLKAHYTKYFFRVTMGLANPIDASRFLAEIQRQTRSPCVLRSKELFWEIVGEEYFPGLASVEGLKQKDIARILSAQTACLGEKEIGQVEAFDFFRHLGAMTESFATTLSKCGALRIFGTPEDIADGYEKAILLAKNGTLPESVKREVDVESTSPMISDNAAGVLAATAPEQATDDYAMLSFETRLPAEETHERETTSSESEVEPKSSSAQKAEEAKSRKRAPREKKLNKTDLAVKTALLTRGVAYLSGTELGDGGDQLATSQIMTLASAIDVVMSSKTKGAGIRHLVAAIRADRNKREEMRLDDSEAPFVMLKELKTLEYDDGQPLETGSRYKTIGISKNISMITAKDGKTQDPRITFIAEGTELNAKFSKHFGEEKMQEAVTMVKDGKMSVPFVVELYVGRFETPQGETITYYKIETIDKIGSGK